METFQPAVYILTNKRNGTFLAKRIDEHKTGHGSMFTKKYKLHTLVYAEVYETMTQAIEREKQLKGGSRTTKIALIEKDNSRWEDISHLV